MEIKVSEIGSQIVAGAGEQLSDCRPDEVRDLLREHGWVYFTGFSPSVDEFREFTRKFGRCATPRSIVYPPGGVALGFHAEDSYNPWRPDALWFLCLNAGSHGGAPTGVVDGVRLLRELDDKWRTFALDNQLRFERSWTKDQWQKAAGGDDSRDIESFLRTLPDFTYEFLADGTLRTAYTTPIVIRTQKGQPSLSNTALHAVTDQEYYGMTLATGEPVPQEFLNVVEKLALEREIPLGWSDGDMVVIDNYRLMHRRGEYHGNDRELRVVHGEEFFGTALPEAQTPAAQAMKEALQGEEDLR
jgi:hypothetical protein